MMAPHPARPRRHYRPGLIVRYLAPFLSTVALLVAASLILVGLWGAMAGERLAAMTMLTFGLGALILAALEWRLARIGIWQAHDRIVLRSMFRTRTIDTAAVERVDAGPDWGALTVGGAIAPRIRLLDGSSVRITWLSDPSPHTWGGDRAAIIADQVSAALPVPREERVHDFVPVTLTTRSRLMCLTTSGTYLVITLVVLVLGWPQSLVGIAIFMPGISLPLLCLRFKLERHSDRLRVINGFRSHSIPITEIAHADSRTGYNLGLTSCLAWPGGSIRRVWSVMTASGAHIHILVLTETRFIDRWTAVGTETADAVLHPWLVNDSD